VKGLGNASLVVLALVTVPCMADWWRDVDVPDEEATAISNLARESLPDELLEVDFESVSIKKQIIDYQTLDDPPQDGRSENLYFYGVMPNSRETGNYRERYAIRCRIYTESVDSSAVSTKERCDQGMERLLRRTGIVDEVLLESGVDLELAIAFLDFLSTQIGPKRGQPLITEKDFSEFQRMSIRNGRPKRVVVYWGTGSTTFGLSYEVVSDSGYTFMNMEDMSYVSD